MNLLKRLGLIFFRDLSFQQEEKSGNSHSHFHISWVLSFLFAVFSSQTRKGIFQPDSLSLLAFWLLNYPPRLQTSRRPSLTCVQFCTFMFLRLCLFVFCFFVLLPFRLLLLLPGDQVSHVSRFVLLCFFLYFCHLCSVFLYFWLSYFCSFPRLQTSRPPKLIYVHLGIFCLLRFWWNSPLKLASKGKEPLFMWWHL